MPSRTTVRAPDFGQYLEELRGKRSLERIASRVRQHVPEKVPASLIHKYERGRVPSWPMLAAFSRVYGVPIVDLVGKLASALGYTETSPTIGSDLPGHTGPVDSALPNPGGVRAASSRSVDHAHDYARAVHDITSRLIRLAEAIEQGRAPDLPATGSSDRD